MSIATKRIFYLNRHAHPVFAQIMGECSDVSLHSLVNLSAQPIKVAAGSPQELPRHRSRRHPGPC